MHTQNRFPLAIMSLEFDIPKHEGTPKLSFISIGASRMKDSKVTTVRDRNLNSLRFFGDSLASRYTSRYTKSKVDINTIEPQLSEAIATPTPQIIY